MTQRLYRHHVSSQIFRSAFMEFLSHAPELEEHDCWPSDYKDVEARGLPKDGALLMRPNGYTAKGAAKILGLPIAPFQWAGHGTRHETALGTVAFLKHAIVIIKSSSG